MLGTLFGFSALSVDIGLIRVADTQLQAAIDAAALSATSELDGTPAGIANARARAVEIAAANPVLGGTLAVASADVVVGVYDTATGVFTADESDPAVVNAVRIVHSPPQIDSALGAVAFGVAGYDVSARSMAVRELSGGPAGSTSCFLPIAVPDCWVSSTPAGTNPSPFMFTLTNTPTDSVAWGLPNTASNANGVKAQLQGQCSGVTIEVGDSILVNEAENADALHTIRDILNDSPSVTVEPGQWDESRYGPIPERLGTPTTANSVTDSAVTGSNWGHTIEGPVALVDAGSDCSTVSFAASDPLTITGVGWGVIYDVKSSGSPKNLYIQLDLINEHDIWGETDDDATGANVLAPNPPVLVAW